MEVVLDTHVTDRVVECDVASMLLDSSGIKDYYWPISNPERTGFGLNLAQSYASIIYQYSQKNAGEALPYQFFGFTFLMQVVAVFQGDLLRERAQRDQVTVNVPDEWSYWPYLMREQEPPEPEVIKKIQAGPDRLNYKKSFFKLSKLKKIFKLLSLKQTSLEVDGLKVRPITNNSLATSIIATQRTKLITLHAREVEKDVIFCRSDRWFREVSDEELAQSLLQNDEVLEEKIINMIEALYHGFEISLKPHSLAFIKNILRKGVALARVHYHRLVAENVHLPQEVWTGTTGNVWDTMLRVATMKKGGVAIGHDHGSGCAYAHYPLREIGEYWGCNEFVTFNKNHAEEMALTLKSYSRYDDVPPKMSYVQSEGKIKTIRNVYEKPKTVFLMATLYDNDRGRVGPGNVNNFLVDWQTRLIKALKDERYDVVLKVHPENKVPLPDIFEELGAEVSAEPVTRILERADVVLFDCIFTTAFTDCLSTNVPVVLLDWFGFPWTDNAKDLIKKRCPIVPIEYKNCRAHPDRKKIAEAINLAPEKCDSDEFYSHYFL